MRSDRDDDKGIRAAFAGNEGRPDRVTVRAELAVRAEIGEFDQAVKYQEMAFTDPFFVAEKDKADEATLLDLITEAGADDMSEDDNNWEIVSTPAAFPQVVERLKAAQITPAVAEVSMIPDNHVKLTGKEASQMMRLMEELEEHEDVQHVYANFDIEESELHALTQAR